MKSWWKAVASYPPTWVAAILLITASWLFLVALDPSPSIRALLLLTVVLSAAGWPLLLAATGTLQALRFPVAPQDPVDAGAEDALEAELAALPDDRLLRQLHSLRAKHDNLAEVLRRRLDAGELTYARYLATSRDVYTAALDNLHEAAVAARSVSAIDGDYVMERLRELERRPDEDPTLEQERQSLRDRRDLFEHQRQRRAELLAQNEAAMTALDRTAAALANVPIGRSGTDAEVAVSALEELASRAHRYADG